jgi:hypothetical protein
MPKQQLEIGLSLALLLAASVGSGVAEQSGSSQATLQPLSNTADSECLEDRPLTPAEARAGLGYPHVTQPNEPTRQDPAKVAATSSTTTK